MKCGLLGRKLSHSFSPQIHSFLSDYEYKLYEVEPDDLEVFMKENDLDAFNVTIPYKKDVIQFCDKLSVEAQRLGAVNTVIKENDGTFSGYNTDYYGFLYMIKSLNIQVKGKKSIVLGSGGASQACQCVLNDLGADVVDISRLGENDYDNLYKNFDAQIIVNATPVGMYPNVDDCLVELANFKKCEAVLDLIYNPSKTKLLQQAEQQGITFANGLVMLIAQAKKACEFFEGRELEDSIISKIEKELVI